ncbi:hypothetical protein [Salinisphaera sp. SPP-AMP-43]|uniref:hypothetical protein n=1 Tax=Salinisphaera sp. SPP-AMP-43 TaxID=3121288 RepID=UPI003C6DD740
MINAAQAHLIALGCPKLMFTVGRGQPELKAYYDRLGFAATEVAMFGEQWFEDEPDTAS